MKISQDLFAEYPILWSVFWVAVVVVVAVVLESVLWRWLGRITRQKRVTLEARNAVMLMVRIFIFAGAILALVYVGGIPTDWPVPFGAVFAAAIGFASSRVVGNFISGLYLTISR